MRQTTKSEIPTSFHGDVFSASVSDLRRILGLPLYELNNGEDKVNFVWELATSSGDLFRVYDWNEYRVLDENEIIDWCIAGDSENSTKDAIKEITDELIIIDAKNFSK